MLISVHYHVQYMQGQSIKIEHLDLPLPPFETYRRLRPNFSSSFILESAIGSSKTVAFSFLGFGPKSIMKCENGKVMGGEGEENLRDDPLAYLKAVTRDFHIASQRFPFIGGLVGYFSYEFARYSEPSSIIDLPSEFPDFELGMYDECLVYDHSNFQVYRISTGEKSELSELIRSIPRPNDKGFKASVPVPESSQEEFEEGIRTIKERIVAGETFQTVLSRRLRSDIQGDPLVLYSALRDLNPSPYMYFLDFGERTVLGLAQKHCLQYAKGMSRPFR